MDENSIYDDLATQGDLGALIHDLQSRNHDLQQHVTSLEVDISKLCDKITEMKAVQDNLTKNISELYNTAKHELERKDRRIADLQSQLDALIFKRQTAPQQSGFKRKWEGNNSEDSSKRSCNYTESELNRKSNYDRKVEETLKSSTERLNPVTDFPPQPENDPSRNVYSRDNSHSRDRRDNHSTEKWDSFRDNHNETRIDQRDSRLEHRDSRFDHKDSRLDHKNTILDQRESRLDHRDIRLGQRDSRLDNRDISLDHKDSRLEHKDSRLNHKDDRLDCRDSRLDLRDSRSVNRFDHRGNRDVRRDHRENFRGNRNTNKSYRDRNIDQRGRINDQRNTNWDHNKGGPREQRYNSGDRRENLEKRPYEQKDVTRDNKKIRGQSSDDFKCNDVRQMEYHSENEPVFSAAESSNETDTKESKEEGELSDDEQQKKAQFAKKEKIPKKIMNLGINLPFDTKRTFSVDKFIEKQSKMGNRENNDKNSTNPKEQETKKSENINEEIPKNRVQVEKVEPRDEERKQMKMSNEVILTEENPVSDEKSKKDDVVCNEEKHSSKVNIISQIILHEGLEAPPAVSTSKPQPEEKNDSQGKKQENKDKTLTTAPKIDKKNRESRVPRNLTDELNINLERSRKRQELLVQLFGSSEKNSRMSDQFSPPHSFGLSQDGEIPELKLFSSPDTAEIKSNSGSFDVTRQTNPVTEFQIFKTNLSSLEKSNSLSSISVQIQSPTSNTSREVSEIAQKKKEKSSPMKKTDAISKQTELSSEVPKQSENPKSEAVVKGQSTNNVCNMSMDYLNMDLGQCEAEDFPNLVALSDISDLLKTPVEEKKSVPKKSVNPVGIGKNINFNNPTTNVSVESKKIKNSSSVGVQEPNKKTLHVDKKEVIPQPKEISKVTEEKKIEHPGIDPSVQSRQISDPLLSPSQDNVQNMPKKSSNSNGRGKGKNTMKPTKTNHKKSNSSSNIDTQTQKPTKNEEEKPIMLSTNKESKSSPMTEVEESLELREIKEFNSKEKTPPAVVDNKNHVETGDIETNKTNTSPKPTECSDISDLLLTPKEKNRKSSLRRSSNSSKTCKSKNNTDSNKQPADPTSQSSSEKSSNKESDKKSNPPNMNKMETRKASVEKVKDIPHQKGAKAKAPPKKKVVEIAKPKEVSEKVSTRSNIKKDKSDVCTIPPLPNVDMKQCKDENPVVSATKPHLRDIPESKKENVKTVPMGANTNKIEDGTNSTKEPIGPDVSNSSLQTTKASKEVDDVNKKPIVDKEPPGNNLNKSTENNTSNNRRRRCAIKLV